MTPCFIFTTKGGNVKILKGAITSLASEGRITLQIPIFDIVIQEDNRPIAYGADQLNDERVEEIPDEWIMQLRSGQSRPVIGKEQGYSFLTKEGWEANRQKIREAFLNAKHQRGTWADFEDHVDEHFKQVKAATLKKIKYEQSRLNQLKEVLKKL